MQHFRFSILVTIAGLIASYFWGGYTALVITAILAVMEVSLSFDNAVVNASVLKDMDEVWQRRFLTWGILIAVFGMRLVFPIVIVAFVTGMGSLEVIQLALQNPDEYARHLTESHVDIAAFGGMFLLLVFLNFLFDHERELHWLGTIEQKLAKLGKLESFSAVIALIVLVIAQAYLPQEVRAGALVSGTIGVILYVLVDGLAALFDDPAHGEAVEGQVKRAGAMSFIYLEILDASFSFDGVIGAFAITKDVVIIMIGLAIGAMFVRSMTVFLVKKGTLAEYVYLEHGAHYAIGALAIIMLISMKVHIPEVITGLIGFVLIALSFWSSLRHNKLHRS